MFSATIPLSQPSNPSLTTCIAGIVNPHVSPSAIVADDTFSAIDTVAAIAKEAGDMLESVPVVKSVAGVVLQILKVRDVNTIEFLLYLMLIACQELISNKERCLELIESVARRSRGILKDLRKVAESGARDHLKEMESDLQSYKESVSTKSF